MIDTKNLLADLRLYVKTGDSAPARNLCTQAIYALERKDALLREALECLTYHTAQTRPIVNTNEAIEAVTKEIGP